MKKQILLSILNLKANLTWVIASQQSVWTELIAVYAFFILMIPELTGKAAPF